MNNTAGTSVLQQCIKKKKKKLWHKSFCGANTIVEERKTSENSAWQALRHRGCEHLTFMNGAQYSGGFTAVLIGIHCEIIL